MLTRHDYRYFAKAQKAAQISDFCKVHVGCIAVYQGDVIGIGCNANKTHPTQHYYNRYRNANNIERKYLAPKLHAEISCINSIRNLNIPFNKVRLYIYRIRYDQPYGLARPCPSCMAAIRDLGIREIYYTTDDGFSHERIYCPAKGGVA